MKMFPIQSLLGVPYILLSINYCSPDRRRDNITGKISQVNSCGFDIENNNKLKHVYNIKEYIFTFL